MLALSFATAHPVSVGYYPDTGDIDDYMKYGLLPRLGRWAEDYLVSNRHTPSQSAGGGCFLKCAMRSR